MKASETSFVSFFQGPKQYVIPIYQRTYSWTEKQCEKLWEDILNVIHDETIPGHFLGSIVYIHEGVYQSSSVNPVLVIDGQQRLTTLTLLFAALRKAVVEQNNSSEITLNKINNYYFFNSDETGEQRYKLILTQTDKDTLRSLLEENPLPKNPSKNIINNYNYFMEQIKKSKLDLDSLYKAICKLLIVDISLDAQHDDPQLIFESLNSTGLELSQADLIRNYVLMGLDIESQKETYNKFWFPMEQDFGHTKESLEYFDSFMRDYLTIKLNEIPKERDVYLKFKEYFSSQQKPVHEIVKDIYYYSKFYNTLSNENSQDKEIAQKSYDINSLPVDVAYPFLLEVFADYDKEIISRDEFLEILDIIESYVFRRQICEIPTNSLNKTFATLHGLIDKENYLESLKAAFILKDLYRRFPNDMEFHEQFQVKNVYNFGTRSYLFSKLENFERKELVNTDEYTLEHIMPQNDKVPIVWQDELGKNWKEVHEKFLHRAGNLTLTAYNSELGDKSFKEKQNMAGGFKDSPIRLNSELATLENWNEHEIQKRSKILADKALKIWKFPNVPQEILEKYSPVKEEEDDEFESSSRAAKLAWATRRYLNPEKFGEPTDEDLMLLAEKNTRLGKSSQIDTIVCACSDPKSLEQIFLKEHRWYKIRISHKMKDRIKYLAMYEAAPVSEIRYIGEVKEIKPFENSDYSEIVLSGKPEMIKSIKLPNKNPNIAPQSHKYTTKSRIDKANTLEDIFLK